VPPHVAFAFVPTGTSKRNEVIYSFGDWPATPNKVCRKELFMVIKSYVLLRAPALVSLFVVLAASLAPQAQAQPLAMTTVTLQTSDKGMIDTKAVATKDIASLLAAQRGLRTGMHIVTIQTCPKVPPDTIQAMIKDMQARKFIVAIDLHETDPRLCLR
jgi:hypothetical protein